MGFLDNLFAKNKLGKEIKDYEAQLNQRPTDGCDWPDAWLNIEIVSPWRRAGTARFIAAAEVASNEYFNPVIPEVVAERLRELG